MAKAMIEGRGEDTERNRVLDIARGSAWPARYTARTLRNAFLDRWRDREPELATSAEARAEYRAAAHGDLSAIPVWAGEALDLITDLPPAADLVPQIAAEAEQCLLRTAHMIRT
jgi:nitronate monooxygenase